MNMKETYEKKLQSQLDEWSAQSVTFQLIRTERTRSSSENTNNLQILGGGAGRYDG